MPKNCIKKIADITNATILSPMAGYSDAAFRKICNDFGAGITVTEMISTKALLHSNRITLDLLKRLDSGICAVQLFGHEPDDFAKCVVNPLLADFDIIDINMGCPMAKIFNNGDGSALMKDIPLASKIIEAVRKSTDKLVSVKFRLGIDEDSINCVEFASMCKDSGADYIVLHARTQQQYYSSNARWEYIEKVVSSVDIPVFANGDINAANSSQVIQHCKCFGVAIGRAALGNPQIFSQIRGINEDINLWQIIQTHYNLLLSYLPSKIVLNEMKKHLSYYLQLLHDRKRIIQLINRCDDIQQQMTIVNNFLNSEN